MSPAVGTGPTGQRHTFRGTWRGASPVKIEASKDLEQLSSLEVVPSKNTS